MSMVITLMGDSLYKHHMLAISMTATQYSPISSTWDGSNYTINLRLFLTLGGCWMLKWTGLHKSWENGWHASHLSAHLRDQTLTLNLHRIFWQKVNYRHMMFKRQNSNFQAWNQSQMTVWGGKVMGIMGKQWLSL